MIQAVGAALSIRWLHVGEVVVGEFCTAQGAVYIGYLNSASAQSDAGAIQQLGETSTAMMTIVCAVTPTELRKCI
jgi:hypothetical protein